MLRRILWENGLSIVLFTLFAVCLAGEALTGYHEELSTRQAHHAARLSFAQYLTSGHFIEATFENWESEFLQMGALILLTTCLRQKGSPESRPLEEAAAEDNSHSSKDPQRVPWPVTRGGWVLKVYEHSLSLAMFSLFLFSFFLHAYGGMRSYNEEQAFHGEPLVNFWQYIGTAQFWFESFQNWQSEFLSAGALIVLAIVLREKGSSQSKPVDHPHAETGSS